MAPDVRIIQVAGKDQCSSYCCYALVDTADNSFSVDGSRMEREVWYTIEPGMLVELTKTEGDIFIARVLGNETQENN